MTLTAAQDETIWLAYITTGRELEVAERLRERGIQCHVARKVDLLRKGKRRRPDVVVTPFYPNFAFLVLTDQQYHDLHRPPVKYLAPTMHILNRKDRREVGQALAEIESKFVHNMRHIESATQAELAEFKAGERIKAISGPFADRLAAFRRIVEGAHDLHPMIEADMDIMGQVVKVRLDPLDVRAAE